MNTTLTEGIITQFRDEFSFLSNFYPIVIELYNIRYPSVEAAYMSAKCLDPDWKAYCANPVNTPGQIKRESRRVPLVENWDNKRLTLMKLCLRQKFSNNKLKTQLLKTHPKLLQEGNSWGDRFWGVDLKTGVGENHLGMLLMKIRDEYILGNLGNIVY